MGAPQPGEKVGKFTVPTTRDELKRLRKLTIKVVAEERLSSIMKGPFDTLDELGEAFAKLSGKSASTCKIILMAQPKGYLLDDDARALGKKWKVDQEIPWEMIFGKTSHLRIMNGTSSGARGSTGRSGDSASRANRNPTKSSGRAGVQTPPSEDACPSDTPQSGGGSQAVVIFVSLDPESGAMTVSPPKGLRFDRRFPPEGTLKGKKLHITLQIE